MNGKPQETLADGREDLLERIITQGLDQMKASERTQDKPEASETQAPPVLKQEEGDGKTSPAAGSMSKRSSVYLYLLILFGAAFLLLLLAYFVQQRSSENAISDLRDSMTLSRQELLDEIKDLEGQVEELQTEASDWASRYSQMKEQAEQYERQSTDLSAQYNDALSRLTGWEFFWAMEQSYQAEDYETCTALILLESMSGSLLPSQKISERREEITQALVDRGFLPENRRIQVSDYEELIERYLAEHPEYGPIDIIFD